MAKVFHSIQFFKATGVVIGRVTSNARIPDENFPADQAQIVHEDDDKNTFPDVTGKRINLKNLRLGYSALKCLEVCPVLTIQKQIGGLMGQLSEIDNRRNRAHAEVTAGRKDAMKWLNQHLDDADKLRAQVADLNKQMAAIPAQK